MKNQKEVTKTIIEKKIVEIICNSCGKTVTNNGEEIYEKDITNINIDFGYGSKYDTSLWEMDICDKCMSNIVKNFKYAPVGSIEDIKSELQLNNINIKGLSSSELFEKWKRL